MRKLSLFCLIFVQTTILAKPVNPIVALQVANNFMNVTNVTEPTSQKRVPKRMVKMNQNSDLQGQAYYLYQNSEGERYIIAADNTAQPVLGFSEYGTIDEMLENMRWWLNEYNREIQWAIEKGGGNVKNKGSAQAARE